MKVTLLGTGTPTPSLKRMSSGYMVQLAGEVILLDHGPGSYHRMMEAGVEATQVTRVFFSHLHYDHCLDYARLLITRWDQAGGSVPELKVYGPPPLRSMHERLFGPDGAFSADLVARTRHPLSVGIFHARGGAGERAWPAPEISELSSGDVVQAPHWRIIAGSVRHVQPYLHCYGYRLECGGAVLAYSGDCGPCKAMERLAMDADVLIHMCHYLSGTQLNEAFAETCMGHLELARLAAACRVRNLVVSHVTRQMDVPGVRERIIAEMAAIYRGNIFFGEDLMEIPFEPPRPSKLD